MTFFTAPPFTAKRLTAVGLFSLALAGVEQVSAWIRKRVI